MYSQQVFNNNLKTQFRSHLINFLNIFWRNKHAYIYLINASYEGIRVEFESKNTTKLVFLLSKCPRVLKIIYDWPIKYYF